MIIQALIISLYGMACIELGILTEKKHPLAICVAMLCFVLGFSSTFFFI